LIFGKILQKKTMKKLIFFPVLIIVLQAQSLHGQDDWTAERIMKYNNITETNISPDGRYVAYVVRVAVMEDEKSEYNSQIWVSSVDGIFNIQYTHGEKSSTSPRFSPDSKKIAFLSNRSGDKNQLFVMRLMGGEAEQITDTKTGVLSFKGAPDGGKIGFLMKDPDTEEEEKKKKEKRDVILVDQNFKYNHIYTVPLNAEDRTVQQVTSGFFHVNAFCWSPDGNTIAFSYAPDPRLNQIYNESDISSVPADSGAITKIVKRPGRDVNPNFSPDGRWIAFESHGGKPEPIGISDLFVVSPTGGQPEALIHTPDRNGHIISWSNDGKFVFVTESARTSRTLYAIPSAKRQAVDNVIPNSSGIDIPALTSSEGSSSSFSVSNKGDLISYVYEEPNQPEELFIASLNGENPKQLSSINADFNPGKHGKTELISWKSSDGKRVEGLLTYPIDYEEGKQYPIILQVHGGPAGVFGKNYTGQPGIYMTQLFAQKGYFILRPNPRGSSGYGKDFRYANVKDWGYGDYDDLMSGVDYVLELGIADMDNQFLMGWSYGGYMTSWIVSQTQRFKAASMGAGLPNLISMTTTTDIPDYLVAHMGGAYPWENYAAYERHSAIYYFKNVETPTQVIHGANDLRVPFTQGQEFYTSLKMKGVDAEMIVYPRTPHGPREPKLLMDVSPRILSWFEKYKD
jgi:dipeptidyl aminopeptidase/acylaminoacyl peptidase